MLCYVMLCYVMLCYVMLCYVMLCYVMLCYVMLRHNSVFIFRFCYLVSPNRTGLSFSIDVYIYIYECKFFIASLEKKVRHHLCF